MNQDVLTAAEAEYRNGDAPQPADTLPAGDRPTWRGRVVYLGIAPKLALWTAGIGLATIVSITLHMYSGSADDIVAREQAAMSSTLNVVDQRLNARLASARGDALFLSKTPALASIKPADASSDDRAESAGDPQWVAGVADLFSAMLKSRPRYAQIRFMGVEGGREAVGVERIGSNEAHRMPAETLGTGGSEGLFEKVAAMSEGEVFTSEVVPGAAADGELGRPVMELATPIHARSGVLLGIVVVSVDATQLFDLFDQQIKKASSQYFAAQDGRYLEPPDITKVHGFELLHRLRLQEDLPDFTALFGAGPDTYSGVASFPSESYLAAAKRIYFDPRLPGRFLVLAELQSEARLLADITTLRNNTAAVATGCLLVGFLAVFWLARLIVRPLRQMTELATRVAGGDRTVDLGRLTRRRDETGELARAFETMVREVNSREIELGRQTEELRRSNHELSHFAYVASHDLQEPLRMVASYLQLLRRRYQGKLDAEADEFIGYAVDGASRMKGLINDVLGYARVSNAPLAPQLIDLEAVVARVCSSLATRIAGSKAEIIVESLPQVRGDPHTIERLFLNLVDNALKYRSSAPPRIELSSARLGELWQISVADNGIGIAAEFHEKVFEIFTRLHSRENYEGTGIGLAACRRIVERHGGTIWIEASPDGGSTFRFTLQPAGSGGSNVG